MHSRFPLDVLFLMQITEQYVCDLIFYLKNNLFVPSFCTETQNEIREIYTLLIILYSVTVMLKYKHF